MGTGVTPAAVAMAAVVTMLMVTATVGMLSAAGGGTTRLVGTLALRSGGETVHSRDGPNRIDITALFLFF
jgi:hypothetical protein